MLDFAEVKKIRIVDVCARLGIKLKYRGEWANAPCPLPSHKAGDKGRNFTINLEQNYWRCFSESCNEKCGAKGGDVINFVAVMKSCGQRDAAEQLASWFGITKTKTAPHSEARREEQRVSTPLKDSSDGNKGSDSVKVGYMQKLAVWLDVFVARRENEADADYLKRIKKGFMDEIKRSYLNGQKDSLRPAG